MKHEELPWSEMAVFFCTKCHKAIPPESLSFEGNSAEHLKMLFKKEVFDKGLKSKIRVMTASCFDVCVDGTQAVLLAPANGPQETFVMHPSDDLTELRKKIGL